ncbi:sugar-binding transcriptional regulator [Paenibacillus sp.]|uniref:sugar-binding transcriptional regulator n=1 Tax=Paenibacillus sp. TaxID=58172 RepID=UPI002D4A777A|nr:sugar-binding domain-containing protein [Paenibacillus sp.]HZG83416.1 sugar-binding domain-containing protein [Paenibacillus sp.]
MRISKSDGQQAKRVFLERIARMYYILELSQQEIADQLNIGRSSVARFLAEAKAAGIVQISIASNLESWRNTERETELSELYRLKECVVLQADGRSGYSFEALASMYLNTVLPVRGMVGLGWGRTVYNVGTQLHLCDERPELTIVQLSGGLGAKEEIIPATTVIQQWCSALRSRPRLLPAPAIVTSAQRKRDFVEDPSIGETIAQFSEIHAAVVGIGHKGPDATVRLAKLATDLEDDLERSACVGDIIFHFYDKTGKFAFPALSERVIGAAPEQFLRIALRIGIARGADKAEAIRGALAGELVHILITDEETANLLD